LGFVFPAATLLPLQILFLNMITDVFPALALGMGKGNNLEMKDKPRNPAEPIINSKQWTFVFYYASVITLCTGAGVFYCFYNISSDPLICNNVAFLTLALSQLFHVFNMNASRTSVIANEITKNIYVWCALALCFGFIAAIMLIKPLGSLLSVGSITPKLTLVCTIASILPVVIIQIIKKVFKAA